MFNTVIHNYENTLKLRFFHKLVFTHESPYEKKQNSSSGNRRYEREMIETPFTDDDGNPVYGYRVSEFTTKEQKEFSSLQSSLSRTKNNIYNIAMSCNRWKYFCTFTFSPDVVDRYNYLKVSSLMHKFLKNLMRKYPTLSYIVVPELHKDKAYHFHGIFSEELPVEFAGNFKKTGITYHIKGYDYGYNSATIVKSLAGCARYITSYITKDLVAVTKYKRRYWFSHSTIKPVSPLHFMMEYKQLMQFLSIFNDMVQYNSMVRYAGGTDYEYTEIYFEPDAFDDIFPFLSGYDDGIYYSFDDDC